MSAILLMTDPISPKKGSMLYYALRKAPLDEQQAITACYGISQTLQQTAEHYQNPEAALAKLSWWQTEIEHLFHGKPQHPLTQQLKPHLNAFTLQETKLKALVEAAQMSLDIHLYPSQAELNQHYQHTGGIITAIVGQILLQATVNEDLECTLHQLGIGLEIIRHLSEFSSHCQRQHLYLPLDDLESQSITPEYYFGMTKWTEKTQIPLQQQADLAHQLVTESLAKIPAKTYPSLRPLRIIAQIQLKQLEQLRKSKCPLQYKVQLTPLYQLLIALKTP